LSPDGGTALINGYDLVRESDKVKMCVNLVGSGNWLGFDWGLNIEENLLFFAKLYGLSKEEAKERIDESLKVVGLSDKRKEVPGNLSSGMRQKLLVAKGFLTRTPIMFLDEPTIGLDPASARDVRKYIKEKLKGELGETILLTTHYMQEAESLCDRVAIMHEGRVIACDSPSKLISGLKAKRIVEVEALNAGPEVVSKIQGLDLVERVSKIEGAEGSLASTIRIHTEDPDHVMNEVIEVMRQNSARILAISPSEPTLEDVFMTLTGRGLAE
jgi:ABC-2 type transport system ATP-binding protein